MIFYGHSTLRVLFPSRVFVPQMETRIVGMSPPSPFESLKLL